MTAQQWTAQYVVGDQVHLPEGEAAPTKAWRLRAGAAVGDVREDR
ncbi:hypothetical protein ACQBAR_03660 [Propionibacteriaceae bacterium Y1685]